MVLGVGWFAQAVMQILSDDGAEVSYEVLVGWRSRLPRIHLGGEMVD